MNDETDDTLKSAPSSEHYKSFAIEPLQYIEAIDKDHMFHVGCIIKYVSRYRNKDGIKDLQKALFYLQRLIMLEEGNE